MPEASDSQVAKQLTEIVRGLVDEPDQVLVEEENLGHSVLLRVHTHPDELGKVIGRQGRTVRALRTMLEVRSSLDGEDFYDLEIEDS